jgi:iron complex outermembrane receptor protein
MNNNRTFSRAACTAAVCSALCLTAHAEETQSIESIEVVGRINTFVSASEIKMNQSSSPDMRSQLQTLPGLHVNGNGNISGVLQYRGLFGDRLRINIDGSEIAGAGPNAMDSPLSHVIGSLYQNVTLHQGIAPVSVGAETIGGAIEIDEYAFAINSSDTWKTQGGLTANVTTNDSRAFSALVFSSGDNRYFSASADAQKAENYEAGNGLEVPSTFYERSALKLRAGMQNDKHRLDLTLAKRDTNESGTPALAMDILFVDALWYRLSHQYQINDQWRVHTHVFGNQNEHDMNNFALRTPPMPAMFRLNAVESDALGISSKAVYEQGDTNLEIGAELFNRKHKSFISNPNNDMFFINNFNNIQRDRASIYSQYTSKYDNWNWQAGVRVSEVSTNADDVSTNMAMMNPNVGALQTAFNSADRDLSFSLMDTVFKVNLPLTESISVNASGAIKERAPSYGELYTWFPLGVSAGLADGRNYIGNLDLKKESAQKLDLGINFQGEQWMLASSVFFSKIDDYILGMPSTNMAANSIAMMNNIPPPLQWSNTDAELSGIEARLLAQLNASWSVQSTFEYVRGKQTGPVEQDLYRLAPLTANIRLGYEAKQWQWHLDLRAVSAQNKVAEQQNETPTAGYALLNTGLEYDVNDRLSVTLLAENLLDKTYADHLAGINRVSQSEIPQGAKIPGAGRNIGLFVQYQF